MKTRIAVSAALVHAALGCGSEPFLEKTTAGAESSSLPPNAKVAEFAPPQKLAQCIWPITSPDAPVDGALPVHTGVTIVPVLWTEGARASAVEALPAFQAAMTSSTYMQRLTSEYRIGAPRFADVRVIDPAITVGSYNPTVDDAAVLRTLSWVRANYYDDPSTTLYVLHLAPSTTLANGFPAGCGYNSQKRDPSSQNGTPTYLNYTVISDLTTDAKAAACSASANLSAALPAHYLNPIVVSHELTEALTDWIGEHYRAAPPAPVNCQQIADLCVGAPSLVRTRFGDTLLQTNWSVAEQACVIGWNGNSVRFNSNMGPSGTPFAVALDYPPGFYMSDLDGLSSDRVPNSIRAINQAKMTRGMEAALCYVDGTCETLSGALFPDWQTVRSPVSSVLVRPRTGYPQSYESGADINGDGANEVLVAATNAPGVAYGFGTAYWPGFDAGKMGGASSVQYVYGDFNGDGKVDYLATDSSGTTTWLGDGNGNMVDPGPVTRADWALSHWVFSGRWPHRVGGVSIVPGDFDGDGLTDVIVTTPTGTIQYLARSDGSFTQASLVRPDLTYGNVKIVPGDFNGDGRTDLLFQVPSGVYEYLSTGGGNFKIDAWVDHSLSLTTTDLIPGDFDGNGTTDVLFLPNGSSASTRFVMKGGGAGLGVSQGWMYMDDPSLNDGSLQVTTGDFNGDGATDLIVLTATSIREYLSDSNTRFTPGPWSRTDLNRNNARVVSTDSDGDGVSDLLITTNDGTYLYKGGRGTGAFDMNVWSYADWTLSNSRIY